MFYFNGGQYMSEYKVVAKHSRNYSGLTDEEVQEAFLLYNEKVKNDIFNSIESEHGITFKDSNIRKILSLYMDQAITRGMEIGGEPSVIANYYREQKNLENSPLDYEFEKTKGVSGVLLPDGEFIKCGNAEHYKIVSDIPLDIQYQAIYFTSFLDGVRTEGNISFSPKQFKGATPEQQQWIEENKIYFDDGQRLCYLLNKKNSLF